RHSHARPPHPSCHFLSVGRYSLRRQRGDSDMARTARLLGLLQLLRGRRRPVTAAALAAELGVSERTLYRDIAELTAQGAPIEGEAGLGYVLRPGLFLPPLCLIDNETEAFLLSVGCA